LTENPQSTSLRRALACLLAALLAWAAVGIGLALMRAGDGLTAEYFSNPALAAPAAFSALDLEPSDETMTRRWGRAPEAFSVRWVGYLSIADAGDYTFGLTSDDGSRLSIDSRPVADNWGTHSIQSRTGRTRLERGPHLVVLEYSQNGGQYRLGWAWSRDGEHFQLVPPTLLSPRPVSRAAVAARQGLEWAVWLVACLVVGFATWAVRAWEGGWRRTACFALFVFLAILQTWPLATNPAHLSRNDNSDTILNEWIIAWVSHQAPRDPAHLFDANIFHPERNTLALSEALLVQSAMAAPFLWAGASPVLAYNLVLLAGFVLTGFATCLVVTRWTGDWGAGVAAGIVVAFNGHLLSRLPHLQALHVEFLPLALLALDRLLSEPRPRHAASLAGWFALQALASYYLFVMTSCGLVAAALARPRDWWGRRGVAVVKCLALSAALALVVLLPYLWPYWRWTQQHGIGRPVEDMLPAVWQDYLMTPARLDYLLLARFWAGTALFPGFVALALAAWAVAHGALKDPRARMCAALGACGVVLSFGPAVPGFSLLYALFPPLHGIRAVSRFGYFATVAVAVVGAFGLAALGRNASRSRAAAAAVVVIPILLAIESLAAPIPYAWFDRIPAIYHRLDSREGAVVAELPLEASDDSFANAASMLHSTASFYGLINGFSGFSPASYSRRCEELVTFPDPDSLEALRRVGVTHVYVHTDRYPAARLDQLRHSGELRPLASDREVELYEVLPAPPPGR
jgi:hypothetical protein